MATMTPGTDPLYAWDTPAWTNQKMGTNATAGLNLEEASGPGQVGLGSGGNLSGYLAQTMPGESANIASTMTFTSNAAFYWLIYLNEGASTTGVSFSLVTTGTVTHFYAALMNIITSTTIQSIAQTADQTNSLASAATPYNIAWASGPFVIPPGYYYLGLSSTNSGNFTMPGTIAATTYGPATLTNSQFISPNAPYYRSVNQTGLTTAIIPTTVQTVAAVAASIPWMAIY
jgi:hypothetical protein